VFICTWQPNCVDTATRLVAASNGGDRPGNSGSRQEVAPEQNTFLYLKIKQTTETSHRFQTSVRL
jgi:hypothetical protein